MNRILGIGVVRGCRAPVTQVSGPGDGGPRRSSCSGRDGRLQKCLLPFWAGNERGQRPRLQTGSRLRALAGFPDAGADLHAHLA